MRLGGLGHLLRARLGVRLCAEGCLGLTDSWSLMFNVANFLAHPLTRGLDIDDPRTTLLRREIIREKGFLRLIYEEWYRSLIAVLPAGDGAVLELGSGAGFLGEVLPGVITSDVFYVPNIGMAADAQRLPLADGSLRGIVMSDVLHHIPEPRRFFAEAARCVRPGGVVTMIEPWVSPWSRWVYRCFRHEPFRPDAAEWELPRGGPLSGANGALPWILFHRDRGKFRGEFPEWDIAEIRPMMPFRYLLSGGVSMRNLMPGWTFGMWQAVEYPFRLFAAMFAQITLIRRGIGR
jgi:SAM-dependent methyltransferase